VKRGRKGRVGAWAEFGFSKMFMGGLIAKQMMIQFIWGGGAKQRMIKNRL